VPETVSSEELQNVEVFNQSVSLTLVFYFGGSEALYFVSSLYEDTTVDAWFLASVTISVSAFTHHNKVVVCHFQIFDVKFMNFFWSPLLKTIADCLLKCINVGFTCSTYAFSNMKLTNEILTTKTGSEGLFCFSFVLYFF